MHYYFDTLFSSVWVVKCCVDYCGANLCWNRVWFNVVPFMFSDPFFFILERCSRIIDRSLWNLHSIAQKKPREKTHTVFKDEISTFCIFYQNFSFAMILTIHKRARLSPYTHRNHLRSQPALTSIRYNAFIGPRLVGNYRHAGIGHETQCSPASLWNDIATKGNFCNPLTWAISSISASCVLIANCLFKWRPNLEVNWNHS